MARHVSLDGMASLIGNLGDLSRDKAAATFYNYPYVSDGQLLNAYRSSWLAQKIVNIPAKDSIREGVDWMAEQPAIEKIEAEQNRLGVLQKLYRARVLGRLLGGGAIFIGTDQPASEPLDLKRVGVGGLRYLVVHSRLSLTIKEIDRDPLSEYYNRPMMYMAHRAIGGEVDIHPSRLVIFGGVDIPEDAPMLPGLTYSWGWSDSALLAPWDAIRNADVAPQLVTSLLHEANVDHFGIDQFMENMADPLYEKRMLDRMALVAANKGINGTVLHDKGEVFERSSVTFGAIPDILDKLMIIVSGAADIPATRLFGQAPAGMSSTGESDTRNYYDRLSADQRIEMTPAVFNLFECVIRSAIGSRPADIWFKWSPLWQLSATEMADIGQKNVSTASTLNNTGLVMPEALSKVVVNQLVESGFYPGLETANEEKPVDWELEEARQAELKPQSTPFADATRPRTLYMRRNVKNGAALVAWARSAGFKHPMDPAQLHVTIVYSKTPLDWMKVGAAWEAEIKVPAGGPRVMERFGDKGAIVLAFRSNELEWRHSAAIEAGASTDFPDYQPHITISWLDTLLDVDAIEAYQGEIVLGPELFSEIGVRA
jgi:phage-related protein (TIGR01555 family)